MQPPGEGHDRIKICEDTDGDGKADKFTVFADKLSIPTSLCLRQRRRDRRARPRTRCSSRTPTATTRPTSARSSSPAGARATRTPGRATCGTGFDNWIYGHRRLLRLPRRRSAASGIEFRQGFFRFKPDGSKLEFLRSTNNNSWGVGFSEEGLLFGSTANGNPSVYLPIPNRYYEPVRGWSPRVLANIADSNSLLPDHREGPAGRLARRLHRRRRPRPLHRPDLPASSTGTARRSSPSRPGTSSATFTLQPRGQRTSSRTTPGTCSPATTSGPRRSWPRSAPTATSG